MAKTLDYPFFDTDQMVEKTINTTISDFVEKNGWKAFRDAETAVLRDIQSEKKAVISTGGGIILDRINRKIISEHGYAIWLKANVSTISDRLSKDERTADLRPQLTQKNLVDETKEMLMLREPLYKKSCKLSIDTGKNTVKNIIRMISRRLSDAGV